MQWSLFLDDERFPVQPDCMIARSSYEAYYMVTLYGFPTHIDFDHDLGIRNGEEDTAMTFVKYIENRCIEDNFIIPADFTYAVHSQNPIGAANIRSQMDQLLAHYQAEPPAV